jgi:hypothetical protein
MHITNGRKRKEMRRRREREREKSSKTQNVTCARCSIAEIFKYETPAILG